MNARLPQGSGSSGDQAPNENWTEKILEYFKPEDQKKERADLAMSVMEETPPQAVLNSSQVLREDLDKGKKPDLLSYMPSVMKAGLLLGAGYLTWSLLKKLWPKKEEEKEEKSEGFFSTAQKIVAGAVLAGLAYLIGKEAIPGYLKDKMGIEAKKESIERFVAKLKEKGMREAIAELSIDSDEEYLVRMADAIGVEKKYVFNLEPVKYSTFLENRKKALSNKFGYATMQIAQMVGFDLSTNIPFTSADEDLREANADAKIQAYIEANSTEEDRKKLTIGELLTKIDAEKSPGESLPDAPEAAALVGESNPETGEQIVSEDPNFLKKHAKKTSEWVESIGATPPEGTPATVYGRAGELVDAVKEDGGQLFCYDGVLYLLTAGGVAVLSSCAFFVDTVADVGEAAATEERTAGNVVTSFLERGGLTYVGGGMALGVAAAGLQKLGILNGSGSVIIESLKGAGRGLIAPYNIFKGTTMGAKTVYAAGQWARDEYKFLSFTKKELLDPRNALAYKQGKAAWAAEEFLKTFDEANFEKIAGWNWEGVQAKVKGSILPENVKQLRKRYLTWFMRSRQDYLKSANITDTFNWHLILDGGDLTPASEEAHRFLAEVKASNTAGALRTLSEAGNRPAGIETPQAKIERLRSMAKESDSYMRSAIEERESMVRRKVRGPELDAFDQQVRDHLKASGRQAEGMLDELSRATLSAEEKVALNSILRKELSASLGIKAVAKEMKGRGVFSFAIGTGYLVYEAYQANESGKDMLIDGELTELGEQIGWTTLETIINVLCPFGLTDFYSAAMGEEILTDRKLGGWERALRLGMGTYSAVTDSLGVLAAVASSPAAGTGGIGVYAGANAVEASVRLALRGLGASDDIIDTGTRLLPRLSELARKVGGHRELLARMQKVARGTGYGMAGATAAFMGYSVMYDMRDSKEIEFAANEMPALPETPPAGAGNPAAPSAQPVEPDWAA